MPITSTAAARWRGAQKQLRRWGRDSADYRCLA